MLTLPKKLLITFVLITCMLSSFFVGTHTVYLPLYVPVIMFAVFLIFIIKPVYFINNIVILYKKTPFKYLAWFSAWALFTIIINAFWGRFFIGGFINSTIGGLFASVLLPIIFINFVCPRYVSVKYLIKFFYFFCWIIFMIAIIEFIAYYFDISVIKDIISILSNKRFFINNSDVSSRVFIGGIPRLRSIFDEPSYLSYFIFVTSPVIYQLTLSSVKVFKNIFINNTVKMTIVPFMWFSIIFSQSPIFLIFNILFTLYYFLFYKNGLYTIIKYLKKYLIVVIPVFIFCISSFIIFLCFSKINLTETFINRIFLTITNLTRFENFVLVEPSLATRIVSYINEFILGFKNILFGIGYGNMSYLLNNQLLISPVPLTPELQFKVLINSAQANVNIFCKIFSETGFIGLFLFYTFIIKLYKYVKKIIIISKFVNVENHFLQGVSLFIIVFALSSLYSSIMNNPYIWIIMGISLCAIKIMIRRKDNI